MSTLTFMGREYKVDDIHREVISLANFFAKNARLEEPLPTDIDLTANEEERIQDQLATMLSLPPFAVHSFWSAFVAHHLSDLVSALRNLSPSTQPQAFSSLIRILSLFPDPADEPYFRKFLTESSQRDGLPNLVAAAFVRGVSYKPPSGPGNICTLISHFLVWCGKASIDPDVRSALHRKVESLMASPVFMEDGPQQSGILRLHRLIDAEEESPRESVHFVCANPSCAEQGVLGCSRCKNVRYCGITCQTWHWKNGHKLLCFKATY